MNDYTETQKKIITMAHTAIALVAIVILVAMCAWLFFKGLSIVFRAVIPVVIGFFIALFFKPYYIWLENKVKIPIVALLLLVVTVLLPIFLIAWWIGTVIINEFVSFIKQMPLMIGQAFDWVVSLFPNLHNILVKVEYACNWLVNSIMGLVGAMPQIDVAAVEASCSNVVAACVNSVEAIPDAAVAPTFNAETTKLVEICTNSSMSAAQASAEGMSLDIKRLGEVYKTYGDQIKQAGIDIINTRYGQLGHTSVSGSANASVVTNVGASVVNTGGDYIGRATLNTDGVIMKIGSGVAEVFSRCIYVLVSIIFFVYFLRTKNLYGEKIVGVIPMLKDKTRNIVAKQIDMLIEILVSFYQRQVLICLVEGLFYGIGFWVVGLPYGFFIGLILGMLNLIPFFGSIVFLPLALAFAYFGVGGSCMRVFLVLFVWGVGQFLNGYFVMKKVHGTKTRLGYIGIIFSFLLWTILLGPLLGMLLAIPLSACCVVMWRTFCDITKDLRLL